MTTSAAGANELRSARRTNPAGSQSCWSLDSSRRFRILTVVDDFTRECLGLAVDTSLTGCASSANSIGSPDCATIPS